jgi:hypothetical protein
MSPVTFDLATIAGIAVLLVPIAGFVLHALGILEKIGAWLAGLWPTLTSSHATTQALHPPRKTLVVIPDTPPYAFTWNPAKSGDMEMLIFSAQFHVTNTWKKHISLAAGVLRWKTRWGFIVRKSSGEVFVRGPYHQEGDHRIPPDTMLHVQVMFNLRHVKHKGMRPIVADVAIVDQFKNYHWVKGLTFKHGQAIFAP